MQTLCTFCNICTIHRSCVDEINVDSPEDTLFCSLQCQGYNTAVGVTPEVVKEQWEKVLKLTKSELKKVAHDNNISVTCNRKDLSKINIIRKRVEKKLTMNEGKPSTFSKTIHCQFRLLNILFSDDMVSDFLN